MKTLLNRSIIGLVGVSVILLISCENKSKKLLGSWKTTSEFYNAIYRIVEKDGSIQGIVEYYDDGTTYYKHGEGEEYEYIFKNLNEEGGVFVDAVSGATQSDSLPKEISIEIKSTDTLEVTTYIMNRPLRENWIKVKK